jgi:hypothetical protein
MLVHLLDRAGVESQAVGDAVDQRMIEDRPTEAFTECRGEIASAGTELT